MAVTPRKLRPPHRQVFRHRSNGNVSQTEPIPDHVLPIAADPGERGQSAVDFPLLAGHPRLALMLHRPVPFHEQQHKGIADAIAQNLNLPGGEFAIDVVRQHRRFGKLGFKIFQNETGLIDRRPILQDQNGKFLQGIVLGRDGLLSQGTSV